MNSDVPRRRKPPTRAETLAAGLAVSGGTEVASRSGKYRQFKIERSGRVSHVWIGRGGAFRVGRTASESGSMTGSPFYREILAAGQKFFAANTPEKPQ